MFFEAVCRVGFIRFYKDGKGECATKTEAVSKTMDLIKDNWNSSNWEEWRWKYLYNVPVHETMFTNIVPLRMLYKAFCKHPSKYPSLESL